MAKLTINTGVTTNDGSGDSLRAGAQKINSNFDEVYSQLGDGSRLQILTTGADNGEVLAFNGTNFVPTAVGGVNSFGNIFSDNGAVSASAPGSDLNIIGGNGITTRVSNNVLIIDGSSVGGGGASVTVSETPPGSPSDGDLWYDSSIGVLAVWYADQGYWIQTNGAATINGDINLEGGTSGPSGATTFLELTDTPSSFTADYIVKVNSQGTALEFVEGEENAASAFTPLELAEDYTAQVYDWIFADTSSGPINITLPTTASIGEEVRFLDTTGSFSTNNLTVISNLNIQGDNQNFVIDIDYAGFSLVYVNPTVGWLLKDR